MKIGIITIYSVPNWGSVLQAFATQEVLRSMGHEPILIDYTRKNEWQYKRGIAKQKLFFRVIRSLGLKSHHRMAIKLAEFKRRHYCLTRPYNSLEDLRREDWSSFDAFVVGSDQVWNSRYIYGDSVYMLSFVPENILKISIASSFAIEHLPAELEEKYKTYLSDFKAISVRERSGVRIINEQLQLPQKVEVLLDPTLMLSRNHWINAVPRSTFKKKEKYILFYMLNYAFNPAPYIFELARHFQNKTGYAVYSLDGCKKGCGIKYKDYSASSISQFIDLFLNADLVITSSFHGTAFALNFGIPLVTVVPEKGDERQISLLHALNLERLGVPANSTVYAPTPIYDVEEEQKNLDLLRNKSITWISNALR